MGLKDSLEKKTKQAILKTAFELVDKNPEKNIDKFMELIEKNMKDEEQLEKFKEFQKIYMETPSMKLYIEDLLKNTNKNCLKKVIYNIIGNAVWFGGAKRERMGEKFDAKIPVSLIISPSMRCNLRCTGCDAVNYSKRDDLTFKEVNSLLEEARELGIYSFGILGGESFFNDYIMDIYSKYSDMMFVPITNGTLFNDRLVERLGEMGNVFPLISLEGDEAYTDNKRGRGVFQSIMYSMDLLKNKGIPFGIYSLTYRNNYKMVTEDRFIDLLIKKGARTIIYSMVEPKGENLKINTKLTLSPGEKLTLSQRSKRIRETKKILTLDLYNDLEEFKKIESKDFFYHINNRGEINTSLKNKNVIGNLKEKSLIEIYKNI